MLISILACSLGFHAITFERSTFMKIAIFKIKPCSVVLNPLVSLFGRLVACSGRKRGNRQTDRRTDRQTDRQTDLQTKYCNPRCACAPRVNNDIKLSMTYMSYMYMHVYTCSSGVLMGRGRFRLRLPTVAMISTTSAHTCCEMVADFSRHTATSICRWSIWTHCTWNKERGGGEFILK